MATPTLVIGLGTTGHSVVGKVKKNLKGKLNTALKDYIRFIAFDTEKNAAPMYGLEDQEFFSIGDVNTEDAIKDWKRSDFGQVWPNVSYRPSVNSLILGAGMVRANGKLGFWYNALRIRNKLTPIINNLANLSKITEANKLDIWITGILSNGTLGGTVIDFAYLLRQMIKDNECTSDIRLMALDSTIVYTLSTDTEHQKKAASNNIALLNELSFWMHKNHRSPNPYDWHYKYRNDFEVRVSGVSTPFDYIYLVQDQNQQGNKLPKFDDYVQLAADGISMYISTVVIAARNIDGVAGRTGLDNYGSLNYLRFEFPVEEVKEYCSKKYSLILMEEYFLNNSIKLLSSAPTETLTNNVIDFITNKLKIMEKNKNQLFDKFDSSYSVDHYLELCYNQLEKMDKNNYKSIVNNIYTTVEKTILIDAKSNYKQLYNQLITYDDKAWDKIDKFNQFSDDEQRQFLNSILHQIEITLISDFLHKGLWKLAYEWMSELKKEISSCIIDVKNTEYEKIKDNKAGLWKNTKDRFIRDYGKELKGINFNRKDDISKLNSQVKSSISQMLDYEKKKYQCDFVFKIYDKIIDFTENRMKSIKYLIDRIEGQSEKLKTDIKDISKEDITNITNSIKNENGLKLKIGLYRKTLDEVIFREINNILNIDEGAKSYCQPISAKIIKLYRNVLETYNGPKSKQVDLEERSFRRNLESEIGNYFVKKNSMNDAIFNYINNNLRIEKILRSEIKSLLNDFWNAVDSKDEHDIEIQNSRMRNYFNPNDIHTLKNANFDEEKERNEIIDNSVMAYIRFGVSKISPFWKHNEVKSKKLYIAYHDSNQLFNRIIHPDDFTNINNIQTVQSDLFSKHVVEFLMSEANVPVNKLDLYRKFKPYYKDNRNSPTIPSHTDKRYLNIWFFDIFERGGTPEDEAFANFSIAEDMGFIICSGTTKGNYQLGTQIGDSAEGMMLGRGREHSLRKLQNDESLRSSMIDEIENKLGDMRHEKDINGDPKGNRAILEFLIKTKNRLITERENSKVDTSLKISYTKEIKKIKRVIKSKAAEFNLLGILKTIERELRN